MTREIVLVADDEEDILDLARYTLELEGYRVIAASDGQEALDLARKQTFDLLLTDIQMPRLDGLDAFQQIREITPNLVGVTMTGYGTMTTAIQALRMGFAEFLVKPFTPDELSVAVGRALEKERLRRENLRLRALFPLFELSRAFMTTTDLPTLLDRIVKTGLRETQAEHAVFLLVNPEQQRFELAASAGPALPPEQRHALHLLADWVMRTAQPIVLGQGHEVPPSIPAGTLQQIGSLLALPLMIKDQGIGVLIMTKAEVVAPFSESEAELLNVLAGQAAVAVENARLFQKIDQAYQELKKIDYLKSEFINIAAHELRTPLSLVLGYAGLLEDSVDERQRSYLHAILSNAMRLRTIVDDMMNLRYLETREMRVSLQRLALEETIGAAVAAFQPMATSKDIQITVSIPPKLAVVEADPHKLELILGNLLSNAIRFTPEGGQVSVWAEPGRSATGEPAVVIAMGDGGPGVPLPERDRIFDRFYQIGSSLTREHGGLGLGLAIVRGLVELQGGQVWVESKLGGGSIFKFTIPHSSG